MMLYDLETFIDFLLNLISYFIQLRLRLAGGQGLLSLYIYFAWM